jgi:hypothetical protein
VVPIVLGRCCPLQIRWAIPRPAPATTSGSLAGTLWSETRHANSNASLNAARAGLKFFQQIKENSIVVPGSNKALPDVMATALINGEEKSLARECVSVSEDLSKNNGGAITQALENKASKQNEKWVNASIKEIQLEVSPSAATSVPDVNTLIKGKLSWFSQQYPNIIVHVVDDNGNDFLQ